MHTHVIRTTEDKLDAAIDEWLGHGETPVEALMPVVLHKGSRDYVVVVRHPEHDAELHDRHRPHGQTTPVQVHAYGDGQVAHPPIGPGSGDLAGWIEDIDRTWIIYLDRDWRPSVAWMHRDDTGAVIGDPQSFDAPAATLTGSAGSKLRVTNDRVPSWFSYLWGALSERRIIDVEFLKQLDPPHWAIEFLEQPVLSQSIAEVDTREYALRRIYDLTRSAGDEDRCSWALEVLGEVRGLAGSQIIH